MKIIAQTDNRICIELTREDMEELDITYDELDYGNIETRRVLWTLLDEARHELGRNICLTQRLLIEAVPDHDGGCSIFFTVMEQTEGKNQSKQLIKGVRQRIVCISDKIDNIGKLSKALSGLGGILKSELYGSEGKYRLVIQKTNGCSNLKSKTEKTIFQPQYTPHICLFQNRLHNSLLRSCLPLPLNSSK